MQQADYAALRELVIEQHADDATSPSHRTSPDDIPSGIDAPWTCRKAVSDAWRTPSGHIARRGRLTPVQRTFARDWNRAMQYWRLMDNIGD